MHKLFKQAFTLIELLVVIAIIGILSGLIVIAMNGTTQKATIAKAQVFSNSLRNSLMLNLVSEWKFDGTTADGSPAVANDVLDTWNGGNDGVIGATPPTVKTGSNCVSGSCLQFDGVDDLINFGNKPNLHFSNNFTIEAWISISSINPDVDAMIIGDYNGAYKGYKFLINSDRRVVINLGRQSDSTTTNCTSNQQLDVDKWYHIAVSYDGKTNTFVNGLKTIGGAYAPIEAETANILMGKAQWWAKYFKGSIDGIRIYNSAIPISQIKEQYYAGLNKLLANKEITDKEYQDRINQLAINE